MTKEGWETFSIGLEYAAFFLAAPDFLGEAGLQAVEQKTMRFLSPIGRGLGWVAAKIRGQIDFAFPAGRGTFVLLVAAYDAAVTISYWMGWQNAFPSEYFGGKYFGLGILTIFNVMAMAYLMQLMTEGALAVLRHQHVKGLFFVFGGLAFTASKLMAVGVALEWLPRHHLG